MHPPEVQADDRPCRRDNLEIQAGDLQKKVTSSWYEFWHGEVLDDCWSVIYE